MMFLVILLIGIIYILGWSLMAIAGQSDDQSAAIMRNMSGGKNEGFLSVVRN